LNRLGHDVVVYEASPQLGGILRIGLPENRLPRDVLDWEIDGILNAGIEAITQHQLGQDFSIESLLKEGFSAVFVATGGWDTQLFERSRGEIPRPLPGVKLLIDFIRAQRAGDRLSTEKQLMILGGGNAALETALTAIKEGADNVHIVSRISRDHSSLSDEDIMAAENQGIHLYFQSAVTRMLGEGDQLTHVEIVKISEDGKAEGERELVPVDTLITGAGRFPELIYVPHREEGEDEEGDLKGPIQWETLFPYPSPFAKEDIGIFRPGEVTGDYKAVVEAIGSGRRAASSIQRFFSGEPLEAPANMIRTHTRVLSLDQLEPVSEGPRERMPERPQEDRILDPSAEIALGYSEEQAIKEAKRCLQCGLICYRRVGGTLH
jgi:NADPH-dependent glutamate synthase beta subunit-like oxidoreductase